MPLFLRSDAAPALLDAVQKERCASCPATFDSETPVAPDTVSLQLPLELLSLHTTDIWGTHTAMSKSELSLYNPGGVCRWRVKKYWTCAQRSFSKVMGMFYLLPLHEESYIHEANHA